MAPVGAEHVFEVAAAEDEDPVEAVGANRAYPTLGEGVRVRRLDRRADHLDAFRPKDVVERAAELAVAIMDEEPERLLVRELDGEVARLLGDPASVRVRAAGEVLDPPGGERDEEEHIDPLQKNGVDREEIAGEHARRLRSQEGLPRGMRSLWRRPETSWGAEIRSRRRNGLFAGGSYFCTPRAMRARHRLHDDDHSGVWPAAHLGLVAMGPTFLREGGLTWSHGSHLRSSMLGSVVTVRIRPSGRRGINTSRKRRCSDSRRSVRTDAHMSPRCWPSGAPTRCTSAPARTNARRRTSSGTHIAFSRRAATPSTKVSMSWSKGRSPRSATKQNSNRLRIPTSRSTART